MNNQTTLSRYIGRITAANKSIEKTAAKAEKVLPRLTPAMLEFGKQVFRPNDQMLEAVTKHIEAMATMHSFTVKFLADAVDAVTAAAEAVRQVRDEQHCYTWDEVAAAVGEATTSKAAAA